MPSVLFHISNGTARITLNRPKKLNALNREMALLLQHHLNECASNSQVRCVVITGQGKGFCAGQDLAEVANPNGPGMANILLEQYNPIIIKIRSLPKPVICAVNGVAAGAGANIALCCDIVVASQSASFIQAFSKIGLVPDSGGTYTLPRLIGWQKAAALMMLGDKLGAAEAERLGMVYKVFDDDIFESEVGKMAETLVSMPTNGLALTKQALNGSWANSLEKQLLLEDELQQKAAESEDFREAINAFIEKRKPKFK